MQDDLKCCGNCVRWFGYSYCATKEEVVLNRYGVCRKWEGDNLSEEQRLKITGGAQ